MRDGTIAIVSNFGFVRNADNSSVLRIEPTPASIQTFSCMSETKVELRITVIPRKEGGGREGGGRGREGREGGREERGGREG